jgi:hypothetical protein
MWGIARAKEPVEPHNAEDCNVGADGIGGDHHGQVLDDGDVGRMSLALGVIFTFQGLEIMKE